MQHILYTYNIADIRQEVEKRTSYLGAMRSTKNEPHLLDRLSLMNGEAFLFDEYVQEAAGEVYDWLKPFCRNIANAYSINIKTPIEIYENYGVKLTYDGVNAPKHILRPPTNIVKTVEMNDYIRWDIPLTGKTLNLNIGQAAEVELKVELIWHTQTQDGRDLENGNIEETYIYDYTTPLNGITLQQQTAPGDETSEVNDFIVDSLEIQITSIKPYNVNDLKAGEIIHYFYEDGTDKFYRLLSNATMDNLSTKSFAGEELHMEAFGKITYHLDILPWQDKNMFPRTDRLIREAIIHYIIFRWFETVNPEEARYYYEKYEKYAHELQLAINSENRNLNKPYRLF